MNIQVIGNDVWLNGELLATISTDTVSASTIAQFVNWAHNIQTTCDTEGCGCVVDLEQYCSDCRDDYERDAYASGERNGYDDGYDDAAAGEKHLYMDQERKAK